MMIKRISVEGGFLDGLDVCFEQGLNTIIGARGTGKSSLIELLRVGVGAGNKTSESRLATEAHVPAVLRDGEVIVTLEEHGEEVLSRYSVGNDSAVHGFGISPNIFSQSEVEQIGLLASGRRDLIDAFNPKLGLADGDEAIVISKIDKCSAEIIRLESALSLQQSEIPALQKLEEQLFEAEKEEKSALGKSQALNEKSDIIQVLGNNYRILNSESEELDAYSVVVSEFIEETKNRIDNHLVIEADSSILKNSELMAAYNVALSEIRNGLKSLELIPKSAGFLVASKKSEIEGINATGRKLRSEIDKMQAGLGEVTRKVQKFRDQLAIANQAKASALKITKQIEDIRSDRDRLLDELESGRTNRSILRAEVARSLSEELGPDIRLAVDQAADIGKYLDAILTSFQGSSLQYKEIAPAIANQILPRALIGIVEGNEFNELAALLEITPDRASRFVNALRGEPMRLISQVVLDDQIRFELLDGSVYKNIKHLSTGQRCSVVLPIILQQKDTLVVIDQPEDHIDNAYISKTLIPSILARSKQGQLIVTTHNANIPVLGEAAMVIHLESDGNRGYAHATGAVDDPSIIRSITNVMEGGKEAFRKRAVFYSILEDEG
jgi:predicted ATPase/uncharacterized coiled-coil protein SlyX